MTALTRARMLCRRLSTALSALDLALAAAAAAWLLPDLHFLLLGVELVLSCLSEASVAQSVREVLLLTLLTVPTCIVVAC